MAENFELMFSKFNFITLVRNFLLVVFVLIGFSNRMIAGEINGIVLKIEPVFGEKKLSLNNATYITSEKDTITIERFRFYLSAIVLTYESGKKFIESNSYHLIDAEDSTTLSITIKDAPPGKLKSISFNIGVDSLANVSGALSGALDPVKGMYWAWHSGYINAKLEGSFKNKNHKSKYEFHIGGYIPPYQTVQNVELYFPSLSDTKINLEADAAVWFSNTSLNQEHSIMMPCNEAVRISERYSKMFSVVQE